MSRDVSKSALKLIVAAACFTLIITLQIAAKETDPGGKDADTDSEIVFEPTSEGEAASDRPGSDEPIDFDAKRPSILGMTVIEDDNGAARVVDVGASSPAWDAGIRKDDVIVSLHGVKAKSFPEWADSVRKVVADTKAGQTIPVQVLRDGSPLDMQLRISERKDLRPPRPIRAQKPNVVLNQAPPTGERPLQPGGVPYPVGGGGAFGGLGVVDDGTNSDQVPTRAAAQLMAVNNRAGTAPAPAPAPTSPRSPGSDPTNASGPLRSSGGTASGTFPSQVTNPTGAPPNLPGFAPSANSNTTAASGQVGTAEFADSAGGMVATVSLVGLPAGTYRVGIGEFSGGVSDGDFFGPNTRRMNRGIAPEERGDGRRGLQQRNTRGLSPGRQTEPMPQPGQNPPQREFGLDNPGQPGTTPAPGGQPTQTQPSSPGAGAAPAAGGSGGAGSASGATDGGAANVPRAGFRVLAQVTPSAAAQTPANTGASQNAAARRAPPIAADTNRSNQSIQAGNPNQANPQSRQSTQTNQPGAVQPSNPAGSGGQFGIELGVVTVRPNGSGQLHQRIEGINVASVVGQSVLVVAADTPVAARSRAVNQNQPGSLGVVASGVIQLVSSGPPTNAGQVANPNARTPGTAQGSNVTQPVPPGAGAAQQTNPQTSGVPADGNQR